MHSIESACFGLCFALSREIEANDVNHQTKRNCEKQIKSRFADRNGNVHATVISHHVMAPERSPRSGNVASTKADKRQDEPDKLVNTSSRNLELLAIAYTTENPNTARRLIGQCDKRQVTLLTCVPCEKRYKRRPSSNKKNNRDERVGTDL